jgi:hypothetical protein
MKYIRNKLMIVLLCLITINLNAKSKHSYFIRDCIGQTKKLGAKEIIVSAHFCSACSGVYEAYIFYKVDTFLFNKRDCLDDDSNKFTNCYDTILNAFHYRYLKYYNAIDGEMKVLKDSTIVDKHLSELFDIVSLNYDSITNQLNNSSKLFSYTKILNGVKLTTYDEIADGRKHMLAIYMKGLYSSSERSIDLFNIGFKNAYYYWLLQSLINNYLADTRLLQLHHEFKYKNKHR